MYAKHRENTRVAQAQAKLVKLKRSKPRITGNVKTIAKEIQNLQRWTQDVVRAQMVVAQAVAALKNKRAPAPLKIAVKSHNQTFKITPPYLTYQDNNNFVKRKAELTDLLKRLEAIKKDPISVCGQSLKQAGVKTTTAERRVTKKAFSMGGMFKGISKVVEGAAKAVVQSQAMMIQKSQKAFRTLNKRRANHVRRKKTARAAQKKKRAVFLKKIRGGRKARKLKVAQIVVKKQKQRIAKLQKEIKTVPSAKVLRMGMMAQYRALAAVKQQLSKARKIKMPKIKIPSLRVLAKKNGSAEKETASQSQGLPS